MKVYFGYSTLLTVVIIGILLGGIIFGLLMRSKYTLQGTISGADKFMATNFVESCTEVAFLYYKNKASFPSQISLPLGVCSVTVITSIPSSITFNVSGELNSKVTTMQAEMLTMPPFEWLTTWQQIE